MNLQQEKIKITDEFYEKYEENYKFNKDEFKTEQEIEVRIPFSGYYSLKIKCKNPQIAMAQVLQANDLIGIESIEGCEMCIESIAEEETYSIIL